jgi:acylphosphatase
MRGDHGIRTGVEDAGVVSFREIFFTGHVQGVGFRYQVKQIAHEFDVSGTVRNLADGRVELIVEGDAPEVAAFVAQVTDRMDVYIRSVEEREGQRKPACIGFRIR